MLEDFLEKDGKEHIGFLKVLVVLVIWWNFSALHLNSL
jgi:hypothetical protein